MALPIGCDDYCCELASVENRPFPKTMLAYVINLDRETARWRHMVSAFKASDIGLVRVPAIDGNSIELTARELDSSGYRWRHGRKINIFEVACYLSHLRALTAFLDSSTDEIAMILEDDVMPSASIDKVVREVSKFSGSWSILRLSGLSRGKPLRVMELSSDHFICVNLGRLKGAGAYMINRIAARRMVNNLLPIALPYDHAMDREWVWCLKAACVLPFPISQTERRFRSSIQHNSQPKLGRARRICTTYPYQAFNELNRYVFRLRSFAGWKTNAGQRGPESSLLPERRDQPGTE
jgi:glycosyl transferase family 25